MKTLPFKDRHSIKVRALLLGQRIDLRAFDYAHRLAPSPLLVTAGGAGAAVLFRYGAVVLFGLSSVEEVAFLENLRPLVIEPFAKAESEEVEVMRDEQGEEGIEQSRIVLREFSVKRLQLIADVLAKSVALAYYETSLADSFDRIEPLATSLQKEGRGGRQGRELLRHIGDTLSIQGKMVGRVEVQEKPELLWESPELEQLHLRLDDEYELQERHLALERKLELIARTAETLLELLQHKRSLRVEWYIVILILVEIMITLYEKII